MECRCVQILESNKREHYLKRFIKESRYIDERTAVIFVYSKLKGETRICLNTVEFKIIQGLNKICICRLVNNYGQNLKIAAGYLCKLEKIPTKYIGIEIFILKAYDHQINCINTEVPTLVDICYFQLFLQGISGDRFESLYKKGIVPQDLFENRLKARCHLGFFNFRDWFNLCCPSTTNRLASCRYPEKHLHINPLNLL